MKKTMLFGAAAMTLFAMTACSGKCDKAEACGKGADAVYTGVIPAADCLGVRYTLALDYDDDANKGDYDLVETYLEADTTVATGIRDLKTFRSEGDFTVNKKGDVTYLKLVKDAKDSQSGSTESPIYFVVDGDSSITMTGSDLVVTATPGMNYTLKK